MISEMLTQHSWLWPLAWQSTLCLAVGLAGSVILRRHAARAHQALLLGMVAALLIPVISQVVKRNRWGLFVAEQTVPISASRPRPEPVDPPIVNPQVVYEKTNAPLPIAGPALAPSSVQRLHGTQAIMPIWIAASSILFLRLTLQFLLGWRLAQRCATIEDRHIRDLLDQARTKLGVRSEIDVRGGAGIRSPAIWCWDRTPVLLVPDNAGRTTDHLDWLGIVCHELAHAKRRDHVTGLFAELMTCLLPWHPLVWWTRHRVAALSEEACDDWVMASGHRATGYARTLLDLTPQAQAALIPGVVTTRRGLSGRIHRILDDRCADPRLGTRWSVASIIVVMFVTFGLAFAQTRERVTVRRGSAGTPPAVDRRTGEPDKKTAEIAQVRVRQLRYANAGEVARAIHQLFGRGNEPNGPSGTAGRMLPASASQVVASADSRTNSIVFTGPKAVLDAITAVVENRDRQSPDDPNRVDAKTIGLRYAKATDTAALINAVFGNVRTPGRSASPAEKVVASGNAYRNAVIVSGLPDMMAIVTYIIEKLDRKPEQEGRHFVYSPRNAAETDFMTILNDLLTQLQSFNEPADRRAAASLIGNPIPSLDSLGLNRQSAGLEDRRVLVCFFDVDKTESCSVVQELARRAASLKARGVSVLAVQAEKTDPNLFNAWLKHSAIPFRIGAMNGVKPAWSVHTLPWLILTDKNHIVTAEGFSIDELDSKLGGTVTTGETSAVGKEEITLKIIDPNGRPVAGAIVDQHVTTQDEPVLGRKLRATSRLQSSDEQGKVTVKKAQVPDGKAQGFYVFHEERRLVAFQELTPSMGKELRIELTPACHVYARLNSEALQNIGWPLAWTNVYLFWKGHRLLSHDSDRRQMEFWVPPGTYQLSAYGAGRRDAPDQQVFSADTETKELTVTVAGGQTELDMGVIDLKPDQVAGMIGKPAPELQGIRGWKNGKSVKWSELRGRYVILDFWGYWCGPCLQAMPKLMELHDALGGKGLVVIAVHDASVASIEEMESKTQRAREKYWGGRDLPFLIALDGESKTAKESQRVHGTTMDAYGIQHLPTPLLIDREGRIQGAINIHTAKEVLAGLLGIEPAEPQAWKTRFNEVYRLADDEILKRIAPPFIPERMEYYRAEHTSQAGMSPRGPDAMMFHWDGQLKNWGMGFGDGISNLSYVLSNFGFKRYEYDGPEELRKLELPGDWIIRNSATREVKLRAFEELLTRELGRKIRFEKRTVERDVIVAKGALKFHPPVGTYENTSIHLYATETDPDEGSGGGTVKSMGEFLQMLGNRVNMPVVDQTAPNGPIDIPYRHHRSSRTATITDEQERARELKVLLEHLTAQTELKFEVRRQAVEVWFVTEGDGAGG